MQDTGQDTGQHTGQLTGAFTALVTPFTPAGDIDEEAFRAFIEWQIEEGIDGLVPCGTTGESATLSYEEHCQAIRVCVEQAAGRVPVLAGAGSNNTREALELTEYAKKAGTDAALLITPYYNKPGPAGLLAHFQTIAQAVSIPLVLYNVPSRTGLNTSPATMEMLHKEVPAIVAIKEATGDMVQAAAMLERCGNTLALLSGDDFTTLPLLSLGGCGTISVLSNIVPSVVTKLCRAFARGDTQTARTLHYTMAPLCRALFCETNPVPIKTALARMGKMTDMLRLPLVGMTRENQQLLETALTEAGLL